MKNKLLSVLGPVLILAVNGCKIGGSVSVSTTCGGTGGCTGTVGGTITFNQNVLMQSVGTDDLGSTTDGSSVISASVPGGVYTSDATQAATMTIHVTTDNGFSSSVTVPLVPVPPAIAPVNTGDTVYSYNLPTSASFSSWVQQVAANTNSTMSLSSSSALPFHAASATGTFTFTSVLTSNATGNYRVGSLSITRSAANPGPGCQSGRSCTN